MYVVLTQDVPGLGTKHSLQSVAAGYFRNFLAPRMLAQEATEKLLNKLKDEIEAQKNAANLAAKAAADQSQALAGAEVTVKAKANEKGKLFSALHEDDLAIAITGQLKVAVQPDQVEMSPIKELGDAEVSIKTGTKSMKIAVKVVAEEE